MAVNKPVGVVAAVGEHRDPNGPRSERFGSSAGALDLRSILHHAERVAGNDQSPETNHSQARGTKMTNGFPCGCLKLTISLPWGILDGNRRSFRTYCEMHDGMIERRVRNLWSFGPSLEDVVHYRSRKRSMAMI